MTATQLELIQKKAWLSQEEAIVYLGVSRKTIIKYRTEGTDKGIKLPASCLNNRWKYKRVDIDKFLLQHQQISIID
jgi:predicted site-specific integrase-resolvase